MSYPNFPAAQTTYPTATTGVGVPCVVTLSGTGVSQVVIRSGDGAGASGVFGNFNAEQLNGQTSGAKNTGVQYVAPLVEGGTLQLTAGLKDAQGTVVSSVNTFTFRSLNGLVNFTGYNNAQFVPPTGALWVPNTGNGLVWNANICTVNSSGLITSTGEEGYAIIEVRYPKSSASTNDFLYALILITVSEAGSDVE